MHGELREQQHITLEPGPERRSLPGRGRACGGGSELSLLILHPPVPGFGPTLRSGKEVASLPDPQRVSFSSWSSSSPIWLPSSTLAHRMRRAQFQRSLHKQRLLETLQSPGLNKHFPLVSQPWQGGTGFVSILQLKWLSLRSLCDLPRATQQVSK